MKTELAYGKNGFVVDLPDNITTIIEPKFIPGLPDTEGAVRAALRNPIGTEPLRHLVTPSNTVAISVCDITRPIPTFEILPVLLKELQHVPPNQIVILVVKRGQVDPDSSPPQRPADAAIEVFPNPTQVKIPLLQHTGAPCEPLTKPRQSVVLGGKARGGIEDTFCMEDFHTDARDVINGPLRA